MIMKMMTVQDTAVHQVMAVHALHAAEVHAMKARVSPWEVIQAEEIPDATAAAHAAHMADEIMITKDLHQDAMAAAVTAIPTRITEAAMAVQVVMVAGMGMVRPIMKAAAATAVAEEAEPM